MSAMWISHSRTNSYRQTATACPRFIEGCRTSAYSCIGIVSSQLQWLSSSLLSPVFSDPNSSATRPPPSPGAHGRSSSGSTREVRAVAPPESLAQPPPASAVHAAGRARPPRSSPPPECSQRPPRPRWRRRTAPAQHLRRIHGRPRTLKWRREIRSPRAAG